MLFRRGLVRGSWVGVGLLVATSAAAPAALAADDGVDPDPLVSGTQQLPGAGPTSAGALDTGTPADEAPAAGPTDAGVVPPTLDAGTPAVAAAGPSDSLGDDGGDPDESDDDGDGADAPAGVHTLEGFFGSGKELVIDVLLPADGMPDDLDLSATRFTISNDAGESYECSLDSDGRCTFSAFFLDRGAVPPGTYRLTQTGHAPGLEAVPGTGTVELCNSGLSIMSSCAWTIPLPVHNTSSFSHGVVTTVRDVAGRPVVGAHYSLGGPDYPRTVPPVVVPPVVVPPVDDPEENAPPADDLATAVSAGSDGGTTTGLPPVSAGSPAVQAAAPASTRAVQATSDADGALRFPGWFAAGSDYTLTPVTADGRPTGASSPLTLVKPASSGQAAELTPLVVPSADEPTSVTSPAPAPVPVPVPVPAPVPAPAAAPSSVPTGSSPVATAGRRSSAGSAPAAAPTSTAPASTEAAPTTAAPSAATSARPRQSAAPVDVQAERPAAETVGSSMSLMTVVGTVFAVLVAFVVAVGYAVRRRARSDG